MDSVFETTYSAKSVIGEFLKITQRSVSETVRDSVAATDMKRSLAAPLLHRVLAVALPSPNAPVGGEFANIHRQQNRSKRQSRKSIAQDRPESLSSPSARAASAFNSAICRRISTISRSTASWDIKSERSRCQLREKKSAIDWNRRTTSYAARRS